VTLPNSLLIGLARHSRSVNRPVCCMLQARNCFWTSCRAVPTRSLELIRGAERCRRFCGRQPVQRRLLAPRLGIPERKMHVIPLGINLEGYDLRNGLRIALQRRFLARVAPEKGLHLLVESYVRLRRETISAAPLCTRPATWRPSIGSTCTASNAA